MPRPMRVKPKEDLIPQSIVAAWQRASKARVSKAPHSDLHTVMNWIVSVMKPAARSRLMSTLAEKGPGASWVRPEQRKRRTSARGRRKGVRPSAPGRRKGVKTLARPERRARSRVAARTERRKGTRVSAR